MQRMSSSSQTNSALIFIFVNIFPNEVPKNSLVLNVSGGRPLSARENLNRHGLRNIDYFAFNKISNLKLTPIRFNEGFEEEFLANQEKYKWAYLLES